MKDHVRLSSVDIDMRHRRHEDGNLEMFRSVLRLLTSWIEVTQNF